jgi:DNA polymerase-1
MDTDYWIVIADGMNLVHRGRWRARGWLTSDGRQNCLERGFVEGLLDIRRQHPLATVVLTLDDEPVRKQAAHLRYKSRRLVSHLGLPADRRPRCDGLRETLAHVFPTVYDPGDEADAEIARLVKRPDPGVKTLIVSMDADLLILVRPRVHVLRPGAGRETDDPFPIQEEFGLPATHLLTYNALTGDRSENIAGLTRLPREVARRLAAEFGSADVLHGALCGAEEVPVLNALTDLQRRTLGDGEARARANSGLIDLRARGGKLSLRMPSGDTPPIRDLLGTRELETFAGPLEWEAFDDRGRSLTLVDSVDGRVITDQESEVAKELLLSLGSLADDLATEEPIASADPLGPAADKVHAEHPPGGGGEDDPAKADPPPPRTAVTTAVAVTLAKDTGASGGRPAGSPGAPDPRRRASRRKLLLHTNWEHRLHEPDGESGRARESVRILPRSTLGHVGIITSVEDRAGAEAMLDFARQRPISYTGVDFEYRYSRPGVFIKKIWGQEYWWHDPTSIVPLLMALVLAEVGDDGEAVLYRFVIDLRAPEVLGPLGSLFGLPIPFVFHFGQGDLFCSWKLGLPTPATIWDSWVAERAAHLGLFHARYKKEATHDEAERVRIDEEAEEAIRLSCALVPTCLRHGIPYAFAAAKDRLQRSFLDHPDDRPFSDEQRSYVSADAEATARLYPVQVLGGIANNSLNHLHRVEMDWSVTNARMVWEGIRVDPDLCSRLREACARHEDRLIAELVEMGLGNPNSHPDLKEFFRSVGLLDAFREGGSYSFDDDHLEAVEDRHAVVPLIRSFRKIKRLRSDKLLTGELVGSDGRLHPDHRVLGAESGRNTMRDPNVGGIGKVLRPLVVPQDPATWGIGEADGAQMEVMIAAAYTGDPDLLAMVNGKDVYSSMARGYFARSLGPDDLALPDSEFKSKFRHYRDRMKVFTLAVIYGITRFGLARQLGIGMQQAEAEQARFLAMFPVLARALREASEYGAIRGYAELCTGLRRRRGRDGRPTTWETNWLRNTPIQGSASVVFKVAGSRLWRRYQYYGARLILPLHDAFVFECPLVHLEAVAAITAEVMRSTVQEFFPTLDPRVDVNTEFPHAWNTDGKHLSLELWMQDPEISRLYLKS